MQRIVTLTERKATETARRRDAVAALIPVLTDYARTHGGRYLLFGSAARGTMTYHSDVDVLMDFPEDALSEAWKFAERACWDRKLEPDLLPYRWCKQAFLDHVAQDMRVLA
jgi:predicted nucleotidyltransferase